MDPPHKLVFQFSIKESLKNSRVSDFISVQPSEKTERPIYSHKKNLTYKGKDWDAWFYVLFWTTNPGYKIFGRTVGYHEGDVERIVILHDKESDTPTWVYFGAHGKGQGIWREYNKCAFTNEGALIVYVSPESHGLYPKPRTYLRIAGFANDTCDAKGELWRPQPDDFEASENQTWSQTHYQVRRGINNPFRTPDPSEHSITDWERFFLFFPCVQKKVSK
jgi:hypothetical protein